MKISILTLLLITSQAMSANSNPVFGENGMVVSTNRQASEAGIDIDFEDVDFDEIEF